MHFDNRSTYTLLYFLYVTWINRNTSTRIRLRSRDTYLDLPRCRKPDRAEQVGIMVAAYRRLDELDMPKKSWSKLHPGVYVSTVVAIFTILLTAGHFASKGNLSSSSISIYGLSKLSGTSADCSSSTKRIRILHLIDKPTVESTMDRSVLNCVRTSSFQGLMQMKRSIRWFMRSQQEFEYATDLVEDAPIWGRGFDGYDTHLTLTQNIVKRYGQADYFDAVLAYCKLNHHSPILILADNLLLLTAQTMGIRIIILALTQRHASSK